MQIVEEAERINAHFDPNFLPLFVNYIRICDGRRVIQS